MITTVALPRAAFGEREATFLRMGELEALLHRTATGVEVVRLRNARGAVQVLPFLGGMVWDAAFDGVRLGMDGMFDGPRPASVITGTYGCLLFHSGLLRNGCPGPEDAHALHGEMPCAPMDGAELEAGEDAAGPFLRLTSRRDHAEGFGAHYLATPGVTLRAGETGFDVTMQVRNLSGKPMDLMYMAHANFAFPPGARLLQPAPYDPEHVAVRTVVPGHVHPTPEYEARLAALARDPALLEQLDPALCDPEQVFYLRGLRPDADGRAHHLLRRPGGDGFGLSYALADFPHTVRWLLHDPDQQVAAFALPSTCEPEGYTAERRKGHVQSIPPGGERGFAVRISYLDSSAAAAAEARLRTLASGTARS